jgi:hypothetical protein
MIQSKVYLGILPVLFVQTLAAQPRLSPKSGFEQRIHTAVSTMRIIDTHEHIVSESEALEIAAKILRDNPLVVYNLQL